MTGKYIDGSVVKGVLVVAIDQKYNARYHICHRNDNEMELQDTISDLSRGNYTVSVFVVEENGLPFNRTATIPRSVTIDGEFHL